MPKLIVLTAVLETSYVWSKSQSKLAQQSQATAELPMANDSLHCPPSNHSAELREGPCMALLFAKHPGTNQEMALSQRESPGQVKA